MEKSNIVMFYPFISPEAKDELMRTLDSRWIGQGPRVDRFERAFAEKFEIPDDYRAVALNSGSSALDTAIDLLDLGPGDEVITTPLTCTATNIPLLRKGVRLVFADIDPSTLCLSAEDLVSKITAKTKAITNVHLGGIENDLSFVEEQFNIPVIDDCAQAIGIFTKVSFSCYSFQAIKTLTTGDGGMLVCNNAEAAHTAKLLRWFGIDRDVKRAARWQPYVAREITHDIERLGHKRQMTDLAAALGLGGLKAYDRIIAAREAIFDIYRDIRTPGFRLVDAAPGKKNVYWLATAIVDRRDAFVEKLQGHGIETNTVHVRNDIYRIFGGNRHNLPVMNDLEESYISIPIHNHMTTDDAFYIRKAIEEGW